MKRNSFSYYFRKSDIIRYIVFITIFSLIWILVSGILKFFNTPPTLISISPTTAVPGDIIYLEGTDFGQQMDESWVEIAGNRLSSNKIISWSNTSIKLLVPNSIDDGLIYLHKKNLKSNPLFFANSENIPVQAQTNTNLGIPKITSIENITTKTNKFRIGDLVSIKGQNFGLTKNSSKVYFSRYIDSPKSYNTLERQEASPIPCNEHDFDYDLWSDQEIRVKIPDGASSGSLYIQTDKGIGEPTTIIISNDIGTKKYIDQRTYVVSQTISFSDFLVSDTSTLYVRIPFPVESPTQRNFTISVSNPIPYMENYKGIILHQLENIKDNQLITLSHQYVFTAYGIQSTINRNFVKAYTNQDSPFFIKYTNKDNLVPADDQNIITKAKEIVQNERNPYLKAKRIFTWLIENIEYQEIENLDSSPIISLETKQGDSYNMAILFCALARASGIPSEPLAGLLIDSTRNAQNHFWAEFWIEGFGWLPVDPALAAGFVSLDTDTIDSDFYFGNIDANRIIFTRGWNDQKAMSQKNRTVYRPRSFAFQPIWEETTESIKSYTSFWESPKITGVY